MPEVTQNLAKKCKSKLLDNAKETIPHELVRLVWEGKFS